MKIDLLQAALQQGRLRQGLELLNAPVAHRYTALYRLSDGVLRNVELADKENEIKPEFLEEVPLKDSFCQFVLRDGLFKSSNTADDHRLDGHKYQGVLMTYHGVPVLDNQGELFGTLCHFDALTCPLSDEHFDLLKAAAGMLPAYLPR
ncbi:MAG: guanylate cyclase [Hydrogenophaga sp.]|nr:guanylate cyclase [Hydrogenophaga sp.]